MRREREERERLRKLAEDLAASKETHPMQWAVFQQIDSSGDGVLQAEEITAYLSELGQGEMAGQLVQAIDTDGDGDIDFFEFCKGWQRWLDMNSVGVAR